MEYRPPYTRKSWDYNRSETDLTTLLKVLIGQNYSEAKMPINKWICFTKHY